MRDRRWQRGQGRSRLLMALLVAAFAIFGYFANTETNPVTGEKQRVGMNVDQERALGLQAAPEMAAQMGGVVDPGDPEAQMVAAVGRKLVASGLAARSPYADNFHFHLLADPETVNAFALPGGQVFITEALMKLLQTDGELAGVLSHEIFHVVGRHSAEQAARAQLSDGLTGAAVMATYDPNDPSSTGSAQVAQLIGQMVNMSYGRDDELESDNQGVHYMAQSGYDPRAMVSVMQKLEQASNGQEPPEFFSTHPSPERRIEQIQAQIGKEFPNGVPDNLKK